MISRKKSFLDNESSTTSWILYALKQVCTKFRGLISDKHSTVKVALGLDFGCCCCCCCCCCCAANVVEEVSAALALTLLWAKKDWALLSLFLFFIFAVAASKAKLGEDLVLSDTSEEGVFPDVVAADVVNGMIATARFSFFAAGGEL